VPVSWALRAGDPEIGVTFHFMDAELDTGPILAQGSMPVGEFVEPEEFYGRMSGVIGPLLQETLERLAAGERGTPQPAGGEYESFFTDDDVWLDVSRPAEELHRLVWAWRYTVARGTEQGALLELDGEPVRVLQTSLEPVDDAVRVECADGPLWIVRTEPYAPPSD
jgi:methionyl-tRNA formyltransferase